MNRIPTEGLKQLRPHQPRWPTCRLNEQNPDRGIETGIDLDPASNEQALE